MTANAVLPCRAWSREGGAAAVWRQAHTATIEEQKGEGIARGNVKMDDAFVGGTLARE